VSRALLDTSALIERARGTLARLPDRPTEAAISAVTLCELHHGVLRAAGRRQAGRLAVLAFAERNFVALPVDERIAPAYGRVMAAAQQQGARRPHVADALIAATAVAYDLVLYTRDRDFDRICGLEVVIV
jgi:predicted nucleic acid-binding protein